MGLSSFSSLLIRSTGPRILAVISGFSGFQSPPAALYCTGTIVLASLLCWLMFRATRWRAFSGWIGLAIAGQACSLQLIWAGPTIRLQFFYSWPALLQSYQGIFLVALLLQAVVVLWGLHNHWREVSLIWLRVIGWPATLVLLLFECFTVSTINIEIARTASFTDFAHIAFIQMTKVALGVLVGGIGAANLGLAVAALPDEAGSNLQNWWRHASGPHLPWLCAAWVLVVSGILAWFVLDRMPHVPDEVAYSVEAKYLATGHLYLPLPPDKKAFDYPFAMADGSRWYGSAPAGWPFVLAAGYIVGLPWLVNPFLGAIAILLAHRWIRLIYNQEIADGSAMLLSFSPWLLFLSASLMPHPLSLVLSLLGLLAVTHARESGSIPWAIAAGLSFGALLHVRALEAAVVAIVAGIWWLGAGWKKLRIPALLCTCIFGLLMAGLYLSYNKALTGDPFYVPINKYDDQLFYKGANRLGFGKDVGNFGWTGLDALPGHGPIDVMINTNQNIYLLNFEMFGWACGSLLTVFLLLAWRKIREDSLMFWLVFSIWAGMSLYWFSGGPDFGARYWYQMIVPLAVLTLRGAQILQAQFVQKGISQRDSPRLWIALGLASLLGVANLLPWRSLDKYYRYRGMRSDVRTLQTQLHFGQSVVFIRGSDWPDYASVAALNPPVLDPAEPETIYAQDLGVESDNRIRSYYPHRPAWIIAGPSVTGGGFQVLEGPLPPRD